MNAYDAGYDAGLRAVGHLLVVMSLRGADDREIVDAVSSMVELLLAAGLSDAVHQLTGDDDGH